MTKLTTQEVVIANNTQQKKAKPEVESKKTVSTPKSYPCPQCHKATVWQGNEFKPFCSHRCKLIDLGAWANEEYRVPAHDTPFSTELE